MRLICPNCDAEYEVAASAIPDSGRDVQCSNCGHAWFQHHPDREAEQIAESSVYDPPPPMAQYRGVTDAETLPAQDNTTELDWRLDPNDPESILDAMGLDAAPRGVAANGGDDLSAAGAPLPDLPPKHQIDPEAMRILREEVARETAQREVEQGGAPDQNRDPAANTGANSVGARADVAPVVARRVARLKGIQPPPPATPARDRLPQVEDVSAKLRTGDPLRGKAPARPRKTGGRLGFWLMIVLAGLAAAAYVYHGEIALKFPQTAPYLARYIPFVDNLRDQLDIALPKVIARVIEWALIAKDWAESMIATLTQIVKAWL